tara:strand:+ start:4012 stop:6099 length:2088 start_codon:yes stop_codon:yes gene_type:complete
MPELLTGLSIKDEYRSDESDTVSDFYDLCLTASVNYYRAVGYFTSNSMELAARGLEALIANGGKMQLVTTPMLNKEDAEAIEKGHLDKVEYEGILGKAILKEIPGENLADALKKHRWDCLTWMIANGLLEIKIAVKKEGASRGIYHEKVGIFEDAESNRVAFSGSGNETAGGLINNFECIDVFRSWGDDSEKNRVKTKWENFKKLWDNVTNQLDILEFPEACKKKLIELAPEDQPSRETYERQFTGYRLPSNITLRDYQSEAINNWIIAKGKGVFKMATGSGKTITALALGQLLHEKSKIKAIIVLCPYRHLVTQWGEEAEKFGLEPILAFESRENYQGLLDTRLFNANQSDKCLCVITTNVTFSSAPFQTKIPNFPSKTLIIADEVHNLGAPRLREKLPERFSFRLGLSATPERHLDESGSEAIFDYFGEPLKPAFTLKDALDAGVLTPYYYHPILVYLNDEETEEYLELSSKIAKAMGGKEDVDGQARLSALLMKRARLVGTASDKMVKLEELMRDKSNESHYLFYCGDGTVEKQNSDEEARHVDAVCQLLGNDLNMRVDKYTAETDTDERKQLGDRLALGELQGLVAIRCLDEGVDIPMVRNAVILASSTNPRQFIQRRGRILRRAPGKDSAQIYDMIVVPPKDSLGHESEKKFMEKELKRFYEFARLARNSPEAIEIILPIQQQLGLLNIF